MPVTSTIVAPALRALLENLIDYAGFFPPAGLSLDAAVGNYSHYRTSEFSWMLRSFVVGAAEVSQMPEALYGSLALLAEADDDRAASIESRRVVTALRPVYCEVPIGKLADLAVVKQTGCFAKIRTGGLKPEAIPAPEDVAAFIKACAEHRLAFKATAGLHHPIRGVYPLTYDAAAPRAVMHGFLNVLMASAFAWHGEQQIESIVSETDPSAFAFDERAHWRGQSLEAAQIRAARLEFVHSIGSCSFAEPVQELKALKLLS